MILRSSMHSAFSHSLTSLTRQATPAAASAPMLASYHAQITMCCCLQGEVLYRFSRCKQPLTMRLMYNCGLPLPESHVDVLEARLRWEELKVCPCLLLTLYQSPGLHNVAGSLVLSRPFIVSLQMHGHL